MLWRQALMEERKPASATNNDLQAIFMRADRDVSQVIENYRKSFSKAAVLGAEADCSAGLCKDFRHWMVKR
jgi:hypothetical protein